MNDQSQRWLRVYVSGGFIPTECLRSIRHARQCLAVVCGLVRRGVLCRISRRRPKRLRFRRWPCPSWRFLVRLAVRHPFRQTLLEQPRQQGQQRRVPRFQDSVILWPLAVLPFAVFPFSLLPLPRSMYSWSAARDIFLGFDRSDLAMEQAACKEMAQEPVLIRLFQDSTRRQWHSTPCAAWQQTRLSPMHPVGSSAPSEDDRS